LQLEERNKLRKELNITKEEKVFLYVGRIAENKGPHLLIQAFSDLVKKYNNIRLVIAGGEIIGDRNSAQYYRQIREAADDIGQNKIIFVGKVQYNEIRKFYLISDVVVIPSIVEEGLTMVVLEAGASGLPAIVSGSGGLVEVVKNGMNGITISNIKNIHEVSISMERLILDENFRVSLGKNAYEFIKDKFSWESVANAIEGLYQAVKEKKNILIYESSSGYGGSGKALATLSIKVLKRSWLRGYVESDPP